MDFFGQQDRTRKQSYLLLGLFIVVMIGFGMIINTLVGSFASLFGAAAQQSWSTPLSFTLIVCVYSVVLYGCWNRYQDVVAGGSVLAIRYGATEITDKASDEHEKRLIHVVAEMAIAASVNPPKIYCFRRESGINAFMLGSDDDTALVVSQGALTNLDRDELLGMVGHEFGHLANGDLNHNMRLMIVLGGLNALNEIGINLVKSTSTAKHTLSQHHDAKSVLAIGPFIVGFVLATLGYIGVLAGSIVRASFSRQRDYLADASSIQFTRHTFGLASTLDKIHQSDDGPVLYSSYKQEMAHLCFHQPMGGIVFGGVFSTHPPIQKRIDAIDKHFAVKSRQRKARVKKREGIASNAAPRTAPVGAATGVGLQSVRAQNMNDSAACQAKLRERLGIKDSVGDVTNNVINIKAAQKTRSIGELGKELSLLLSLMVEASGYSGDRVADEYSRVLRCYTNEKYPQRSADEEGIGDELELAFQALREQPMLQRESFVQHCYEIMQLDGIVMEEELSLVNLFAASLGVPTQAAA